MFGDAGLWKESQVISSIIVVGGMLAAIGVLARSFRRPVQAEDASLWGMFAVVSAMIFGAVVNFRWPNPGPSVLALFAYPCIAVGACLCIAIRLWQNDRRAEARSITRTALMWGLLWNGFITMQFVIASPRTHSGAVARTSGTEQHAASRNRAAMVRLLQQRSTSCIGQWSAADELASSGLASTR